MKTQITRQIVNVLAVILTIIMNALANILPLNGKTTGEISDQFDVYFVPAGYVFSIWSVIYLGLIVFAVYQALPAQRTNPRLKQVGYWFALSCLANVAWLILWHYQLIPLSIVAMITLLGSLIIIYQRLRIGLVQVDLAEKWFVHIPFSIYLGWITVATVANATTVLDYLNWNGWSISPITWTVIMLAVASLIGVIIGLTRGDVSYTLVLVWAFVGIAIKQADAPVVPLAAWIAAGVIGILSVVVFFRKQQDNLYGRRPEPIITGG